MARSSRKPASARPNNMERAESFAQTVADRVAEQIERGTAPWQKPWAPGQSFMPMNPTTGNRYRGINSMWLLSQGRSDPRWLTYNQARAAGAQVRAGEKSTTIQYWKMHGERQMRDDVGKPVLDADGAPRMEIIPYERPRVMTAHVFNAEQVEGLPPLEVRAAPDWERHARAEAIMAASPAMILHEPGDRAFYRLDRDTITLPERGQFETADRYYATALHEIGHATGHPSRLDRPNLGTPFGSMAYAREELVAEMASLIIGEEIGIGHDPSQHMAYLASWAQIVRENPGELFQAAAAAEAVMKFVLELEREHERAGKGGARSDLLANLVAASEALPAPATGDVRLYQVDVESPPDAPAWSTRPSSATAFFEKIEDLADALALRHPQGASVYAVELEAGLAASLSEGGRVKIPEAIASRRQQIAKADQLIPRPPAPSLPVVENPPEQTDAPALAESEPAMILTPDLTSEPQPANLAPERVDLAVPYAEKDEAKAAGARYDGRAKVWYAPAGTVMDQLERWLPHRTAAREAAEAQDPRLEFANALARAGFRLQGLPEMDGEWHRVPLKDDRGEYRQGKWHGAQNGSYRGFLEGVPNGQMRTFKSSQTLSWVSSKKRDALSAAELARLNAESTKRKQDRADALEKAQKLAASVVAARLSRSPPATGLHPYLDRKGVGGQTLRVMMGEPLMLPPNAPEQQRFGGDGYLLVPIQNIDGQIISAQAIDPRGEKRLAKGCSTVGGFHQIGAIQEGKPAIVCEGYATGRFLADKTGLPVFVAISAGNMPVVAAALRERYPELGLIIAGDNDHVTAREVDPQTGKNKPNTGKEKSEEAAELVGGFAMIPEFEERDRGSDWLDLFEEHGEVEFMRQLAEKMALLGRHQVAERLREAAREQEIELELEEERERERIAEDELEEEREREDVFER